MLADFIAKFSNVWRGNLPDHHRIFETDGSSKEVDSGADMVLQSSESLLVA